MRIQWPYMVKLSSPRGGVVVVGHMTTTSYPVIRRPEGFCGSPKMPVDVLRHSATIHAPAVTQDVLLPQDSPVSPDARELWVPALLSVSWSALTATSVRLRFCPAATTRKGFPAPVQRPRGTRGARVGWSRHGHAPRDRRVRRRGSTTTSSLARSRRAGRWHPGGHAEYLNGTRKCSCLPRTTPLVREGCYHLADESTPTAVRCRNASKPAKERGFMRIHRMRQSGAMMVWGAGTRHPRVACCKNKAALHGRCPHFRYTPRHRAPLLPLLGQIVSAGRADKAETRPGTLELPHRTS